MELRNLKHRDGFAVNVALIRDCKPVLEGVLTPALKGWYYGLEGDGTYHSSEWRAPNVDADKSKAKRS